jgi:predicted  nucleic acid-binding Zn-ribbon protein
MISVVILLGLFWIIANDAYQAAKARKFYKKGYEEEKKRRKEYRSNKLVTLINLENQMHTFSHDLQQIKHRLTTIRKTTKKDLKAEGVADLFRWYAKNILEPKTKLSNKTVVVKPKRFKGK